MKTSEIRELTVAEIIERTEVEQTNLLKQKLNHAVSPAENTAAMRKTRRDIARLQTILRQKQSAR